MNLILQPTTEDDVREVYPWEYEPPYHIYNMFSEFSAGDEVDEAVAYFLNPEYEFHTIFVEESGELVGICSFGEDGQVTGGDYSAEAIDIGLGVKPEFTGRGLGIEFVRTVTAFAEQTFQSSLLRVTIAEFNVRAQKVWQRAGFVETSRFKAKNGGRPFVIYTRQVAEKKMTTKT